MAMRGTGCEMAPDAALAFLAAAQVIRVATVDARGGPILRTVHGIVVDGAIAFHGAPAGEKMLGIGQPAVAAAEEIVASIPSYFLDPERACPATTYYRSVQVHGRLEKVDDPVVKAYVLQRLMDRLQPEGGYTPITADDPLYVKAVAGILVVQIPFERVSGKAQLGQKRRADALPGIMTQMWRRGEPTDPRAIDLMRSANPTAPDPGFLQAPVGIRLICAPEVADLDAVIGLLTGPATEDRRGEEALRRAHRHAQAWVIARDGQGRLVGTARAVSDGDSVWVRDVAVETAWADQELRSALVRLVLDHPAVRPEEAVLPPTTAPRPGTDTRAPKGCPAHDPSAGHSAPVQCPAHQSGVSAERP